MRATVVRDLGFEEKTLDRANALRDLSSFADTVERVLVNGLSDAALLEYLSEQPEGVILYTGGGIVPAKLLSIPQLRFLHVHPGHLPDIRGADCALWSMLLTGHASASCFYMAPGIDTGDVILPRWLPITRFDRAVFSDVDLQIQYRAVYGFLDPWVRAFVLRELLDTHGTFSDLDSKTQVAEDGTTFHFMHRRLQEVALARVWNPEE